MQRMVTLLSVLFMITLTGCQEEMTGKSLVKQQFDKSSLRVKLKLAEQDVQDEKFTEAARTLRECLVAEPNNVAANILYAKTLLTQQQYDAALTCLETALANDANASQAWFLIGTINDVMDDHESAQLMYTKALEIEPENSLCRMSLAENKSTQGENNAACELAQAVAHYEPVNATFQIRAAKVFSQAGRYDEAITLYRQASALLPTGDTQMEESVGYCYMHGKRWNDATKVFERLAENADEVDRAHYWALVANCSMQGGNYDKAAAVYEKLSADNRGDASFWVQLGQASLGAKDARRSVVYGRKALDIRPGYNEAIVLIGCGYYMHGDYHNAVKYFQQACNDANENDFSQRMLVRCREKLGLSDPSQEFSSADQASIITSDGS